MVVNKIDKPSARPEHVVDEVLELFIELGADDDQLDFPVVYASALNGTSSESDDPADQEPTIPNFDNKIIEHVPAPVDNSDEPLQFQVSLLDYNDYVGRIGISCVPWHNESRRPSCVDEIRWQREKFPCNENFRFLLPTTCGN